jgi:glycosyltransferase involved in cell wall biosynthesis
MIKDLPQNKTLMVVFEDRFIKASDGKYYSDLVDYNFLKRYLQVFNKVVIFARTKTDDGYIPNKPSSSGEGISFFDIPTYIGIKEYLKNRYKIKYLAAQAVKTAGVFILRVPGPLSVVLWKQIVSNNKPYGVEVRGDPWDVFSFRSLIKFHNLFLKFYLTFLMKKQCDLAKAAAYVTKTELQKRYPNHNWTTYFSSIDLPSSAVINKEQLTEKFKMLEKIFNREKAVNICHIGTMDAKYKAQDILLKACSICIQKGLNINITLIGGGRYFDYYVQVAKGLNILEKVKFTGILPMGMPVWKELDRNDIFVLCSITEGLPRAVIEAMARGLPCIGTKIGGIPELIEKDELVEPNDVNALAEKILDFTSDMQRLKKLALRNIAKSQEYVYEVITERRIKFYNKLKECID